MTLAVHRLPEHTATIRTAVIVAVMEAIVVEMADGVTSLFPRTGHAAQLHRVKCRSANVASISRNGTFDHLDSSTLVPCKPR